MNAAAGPAPPHAHVERLPAFRTLVAAVGDWPGVPERQSGRTGSHRHGGLRCQVRHHHEPFLLGGCDASDGVCGALHDAVLLWLAGAVGAGLLTWYGLSQRQPLGLVAAATSLGLMARASILGRTHAGSSLARSVGEAVSRFDSEGFEGERTIEIAAAPEIVFDVWSRYENFPHFMSPVIEVRDLGNQRSRWVAQGPGGKEVEWDCVLAESTRPHRLAWRSESGALVDHTGSVQFEPVANGSRATLRVSWRPPADAVGKGMAVRMGADPEAALEEDLQRMKQFIERTLSSREGRREGEVRVTGRSTILH